MDINKAPVNYEAARQAIAALLKDDVVRPFIEHSRSQIKDRSKEVERAIVVLKRLHEPLKIRQLPVFFIGLEGHWQWYYVEVGGGEAFTLGRRFVLPFSPVIVEDWYYKSALVDGSALNGFLSAIKQRIDWSTKVVAAQSS